MQHLRHVHFPDDREALQRRKLVLRRQRGQPTRNLRHGDAADRRNSRAQDRLGGVGRARDAPFLAERLDLDRQAVPVRRNVHAGMAVADHRRDAAETDHDRIIARGSDARVEILHRGVELLARDGVECVQVALRQLARKVGEIRAPLFFGHGA